MTKTQRKNEQLERDIVTIKYCVGLLKNNNLSTAGRDELRSLLLDLLLDKENKLIAGEPVYLNCGYYVVRENLDFVVVAYSQSDDEIELTINLVEYLGMVKSDDEWGESWDIWGWVLRCIKKRNKFSVYNLPGNSTNSVIDGFPSKEWKIETRYWWINNYNVSLRKHITERKPMRKTKPDKVVGWSIRCYQVGEISNEKFKHWKAARERFIELVVRCMYCELVNQFLNTKK